MRIYFTKINVLPIDMLVYFKMTQNYQLSKGLEKDLIKHLCKYFLLMRDIQCMTKLWLDEHRELGIE